MSPVQVVVDYVNTRFSNFAIKNLHENKKVHKTFFACSYGAQIEISWHCFLRWLSLYLVLIFLSQKGMWPMHQASLSRVICGRKGKRMLPRVAPQHPTLYCSLHCPQPSALLARRDQKVFALFSTTCPCQLYRIRQIFVQSTHCRWNLHCTDHLTKTHFFSRDRVHLKGQCHEILFAFCISWIEPTVFEEMFAK